MWTQGLAWAWWCACVQEASLQSGLAAALGQPDRIASECGRSDLDRCSTCVRMRVRGLGQGQTDAVGVVAQGFSGCHGTSL